MNPSRPPGHSLTQGPAHLSASPQRGLPSDCRAPQNAHGACTPSDATQPCLAPCEVQFLRERLLGHLPPLHPAPLQHCVNQVFASDELVEAYCFPKTVSGQGGSQSARQSPRFLIPLDLATKAARQAERMALVRPSERPLTYLAALLYPCALFHGAHPGLTPSGTHPRPELRGLLLEDALHSLRRIHPPQAATLSAVLGLGAEGIDPDQVARLSTAVCLSHLSLTAQWQPRPLSIGPT